MTMIEKEEYIRLLAIAAPRTSAALFGKYSAALLEQQAGICGDKASGQLLETLSMKYAQAENDLERLEELKDKLLGMAADGPQLPSE
jgi:hypothetical protein